MSRCIYCLQNTGPNEPLEHVLPAALGCEKTLPRGTVCGTCNQRTARLDAQFLRLDEVKLLLGMHSVPDRYGKRRERFEERLTFPGDGSANVLIGKAEWGPGATVTIPIRFAERGSLDEAKLNRAVCKAAFNSFAFMRPDLVFEPDFNRIRHFVRQPMDANSLWPYLARGAGGGLSSVLYAQGDDLTVRVMIQGIDLLVGMRAPHKEVDDELCAGRWRFANHRRFWRENSFI